jgi:release factor glutamine methyltransferase
MTWRDTIAKAGAYLQAKAVPDPQVAAELLAARLLKTGRGTLAAHFESEVPEKCLEAMRRGIKRLASGEPVQYVIGEWDFRHLTLKCDRRALIPRPETEELVTRVLKYLESRTNSGVPVVVDVGTGTGAIVLSLAQEFKGDAAFLGTDVSEDAIALAQENAAKCALAGKVKFAVADGLDDFDEPECIDVIVSNPPYIESAVCDALDPRVRDYEPRLALDGGATGLDFYDRYLGDALNVLKPGGAVFFEIGEGQGGALAKLMADYGFADVKIEKDFAGHDRYASGVLA